MTARRLAGNLGVRFAFAGLGVLACGAGERVHADPSGSPSAPSAPQLTPSFGEPGEPSGRPASWATPLSQPGLPNLFRVSDALYRGAQPDVEGFRSLWAMGVKTIVNLRSSHSDESLVREAGLARDALGMVEIPTVAWRVREQDIVQFLRVVTDPARQPVFVHCQHGADRTGTMVAAYRIVLQEWSKDEAIREMTDGGYGFHAVWSGLTETLREMDVERVRHDAAVQP